MRMIWVTFQKEGFHKYPDAPDEVAFLRDLHRHIFHFKVWIEVHHDDREIEFILFKRYCIDLFEKTISAKFKSCEMLSNDLWERIHEKYPNRKIYIEVSEDGENGSYIEYDRCVGV